MSNLVPEQRVNKLGHVVTKHIKADNALTKPSTLLPAPGLPTADSLFPQEDAEISALLQTVGTNFSKANFALTYDHMELLEGTKVKPANKSLLKALAEATDEIDERGAVSLLDGFGTYRTKNNDHFSACLEVAARAYRFCRSVDDLTPSSNNTRNEYFSSVALGGFTKDFFYGMLESSSQIENDDVTELEGAYLLDKLDMNDKERFHSEGAYFRALHKLKERRKEVLGYFPLLVTARMVSARDYTSLGDVFDLMDYLKTICPPEKSAAIAAECVSRRVFNVDAVEQMAKSDTAPLIDGVL